MEPERKIEKLLRAYAKRRRTDAGDPLTMHPATRRLLQGEIARRKPKPDDEESSVTLWELFRQRWALLAGFAVIVFFGAALFLPTLSKAKFKAQKITAMNNLKQIGMAAQMAADENHGSLPASLDGLTNELGSDKALTDPETGKPFVYVASGEKLERLSSNSVLAYSLADKKGHAVLFADGRVEMVNGQRLSELTNRGLSQLVAADNSASRQLVEAPAELKDTGGYTIAGAGMLTAKAPAAAPPALNLPARLPGAAGNEFATQTSSVQFASNVAQNSFKNTVALNKTAAVLANFQVQQNGNAIRVVDADGSVYDGSLQPESVTEQNASFQTAMPPSAGAPAIQQDERKKTIATRDELQTAQNYFFRVTGMNQTLKQKVVFAGNLLANTSAPADARQSLHGDTALGIGGSGGSSQSSLTNQLPWSNSRIAGTAIVADTNTIEINAAPIFP
jgi:hypothetical protein